MINAIISRTSPERLAEPAECFAAACNAVGGVILLHDLAPDIVTVSFGDRTPDIHARLRRRGWHAVGSGEWNGEPVIGTFFGSGETARDKAERLSGDIIEVVTELAVEEDRAW